MFAASYSQSSDAEEVLPMFGLSDLALGVAEAEESEEFDDDVDGDSDPSKKKRIRQPPREPVICEVCHKQFTRKAHLVRHMYLHTGEKPFKCNLCTQSFNRKDHLRSHMKGHADSKFKCNHCPLTFPKSDLLRVHVLKNHGKYQKTFKAPSSSGPAATPADQETSETPKLGFKVLTCRFCGMKFTQSQAYNRHVASHKRGQVAGADKSESDNEEIVDENENGIHNIILPQNVDLEKALNAFVIIDSVERDLAQKHVDTAMSSDEGVEDDQDRQEGDEVSEKDDGDSSQDGGLEIDTGEDEDDLREDENDDGSEHQGDRSDLDPPRKMECVVCGKDNFSDQRALRRHYKVHKRRFICRFCGIKMSSAGSLMRHNMLHTGEKPFKCDKCNRKFSRKDALKAHLVAHEKDNVKHALPRPFVCTKCSASYTMRYNLIRHMRQCHHSVNRSQNGAAGGRPTPVKNVQEEQHGDTDESNIPVIDSTNESGGHQKITINPNDPLRCMHCNKVFSTMKSLSTHIWYHNQDRRFICKVCQRAFKYATDLHRHEMTHNTAGKRGVSITQQRAQNRLALARQQTKVTAVAHRAPPNHSSIVVNGQRRYPCEYCTVIFNHRSNRSRHVRIFHADQQQQVQQGRTGFPPVQQRLQIKPSLQQQRQLIASKQALLRRQTTVAAIPFNRRRPQPVSRNQLNLKPNQANAIMQAQQLQIRQARQSIESIDADDCEPNFNGNMFKCDLCDKVFDKRYNYKLHLRTHNKQFSCIVCGLKTASQGDLTLHIRTHTGEKPFKCSYPSCEWKFARRSALTVHYRRHHGPNAKIKRQYNPQRITPNMMQSGSEGGSPAVEVAGSPGGPDNSILKTMLENFPCKEEVVDEMEEEPKPVPTPVKIKKNLPPPPPLIRYPIPASMMTRKEIVTAPMEEEKKMSPEVVFFCKPCQRLISGKDNYVDHMLEMHGTTVTAIDSTPVNRPSSSKKMIPPTLLKRPLGVPQPSVYTCHTCGEVFGSRHDFTVHNLITHCYGTGKFKCGLCQVSVTDLAFLARHYQYVHPRAKNAGEEARLMIANTIAQDDEMDYEDNMNDVGDAAADMLLYPEVEVVVKEEEPDQPSQNFESEGDLSLTPTDTASQSSQQGTSPVVRKPVPGIMPVDPNLPFPCPLCNKGFKDKKALADHKWYHSREAIYPCTVSGCDKRFKLKNDLIRHLRRHLQTRPFACTEPGCESRFYQNSDLSRHLNKVHNQHETAAFSCDHCSGSFTRPELLVRHMKNSHPTEDVSHLLLVQMHEKKKRDEEKQVQDFLANLPPEEEEEEAPPAEPEWSQDHDLDYSFELQQLEIDAFDNEDDLTYHDSQNPTRRQFNSPSKGINNNTTMMEKLANENGVLENGPPYACQNCSKVFEDRQKFIYHRYYHLRDYRYTCPEEGCGEKFKIKGHVERHIKTYHNSEKPVRNVFHCPITGCSRKFTREYDLSNHIDRMHNGPSDEVNNEANYEEMVQMLEFENTSQDEENAEETFEQEVNPEYFEQVEQYETKPFVKSPSPAASSSILQPCMNKLEEYTNDKGELFCKACNKHFKDLKTLQNHVYYHQRESKHKCEECGAKFKQKSDLRRHMSIHHDPNKKRQCIPCPNCNRSFTHERYLNIHLNKECDGGAKDTAQETNEQDQNQEEEWFPLNPQVDIEEVDETNGQQEQEWNDEVEQPDPLMFVSNDVQGDNEEYNNEEYGEEEDEGYDKGHHTQQQNVFECDMCDTFFSRSNELILHRRSVHSEAGMSSPPKSRNTPPSSQSTKGKVKTFTCNKCGMSFMQKAELTQHLQQYHLDELPIHQCQFCPKYFYVKKSLDTHRRRHHSHLLNLIACQICGMKFQAKEYLVSHMKSHHQIN